MLRSRFASFSLLASTLFALGCPAQKPAAAPDAAPSITATGVALSPEIARRVEVMLRRKANLPPETTVHVGNRNPSEFAGYDTVLVTVENEGRTSKPITFLLSSDSKTLAQLTRFDLSVDPRDLVSAAGRPSRGGPASAPVQIVAFDDLECPYCARLHAEIFPALTQRYGDKVHIVYKDFPLTQIHPWAMRAAVDTNCLAEQSGTAYWSSVDYVHAHAGEIGADPKDPKADKTQARADDQLDTIIRDQAKTDKLDLSRLNACLTKQDETAINASREVGNSLGLEATPTLFINGDKIDGAVSLPFLYGIIDQALRVAGVQPPPPYVAPAAPSGKADSKPSGS